MLVGLHVFRGFREDGTSENRFQLLNVSRIVEVREDPARDGWPEGKSELVYHTGGVEDLLTTYYVRESLPEVLMLCRDVMRTG